MDTHTSEYIAPFLSTGMSISVNFEGFIKLSSANSATYSITRATIVSHIPWRFATSSGVLRTLVSFIVFITVTSHLIRCLLAKDAGGLNEEDNYQQDEGERVGEHSPALAE